MGQNSENEDQNDANEKLHFSTEMSEVGGRGGGPHTMYPLHNVLSAESTTHYMAGGRNITLCTNLQM